MNVVTSVNFSLPNLLEKNFKFKTFWNCEKAFDEGYNLIMAKKLPTLDLSDKRIVHLLYIILTTIILFLRHLIFPLN